MDSMEMEVMEARLIRASELNGEMDDDDTGQTHSYTVIRQTLQDCRNDPSCMCLSHYIEISTNKMLIVRT